MKELYEKVVIKTEADLPKESGNYLTEFGWLRFSGKWIYPTMENRTYTRGVDWYLQPVPAKTEQETNEQPKRVSDEEKTPEAIFKDFASFNKFLYDLTQYEMEVIIAMLYEQKAYASQHPIEQEKYGITDKIIEEAMNINTPFFGNSGAKFPIIEQDKVTDEEIEKWSVDTQLSNDNVIALFNEFYT